MAGGFRSVGGRGWLHESRAGGIDGLLCCAPLEANEAGSWVLQGSIYTQHFDLELERRDDTSLIGLEYYHQRNAMVGGDSFRNSFGQPSWYLFAGRRYDHAQWPVFGKITGGLLYGYRGEYQDEVPLNYGGYSPSVFPSAGIQLGRYQGEVMLVGVFGIVVNVGFAFW